MRGGASAIRPSRAGACLAFLRPRPGDSEWAHPVDGLIALVDLTELEIRRIDDHGVVPIPPEPGNFDVEAATADGHELRDDINRSRSSSRTGRASSSTAGCCAGRTGRCTSASPRARAWS